MQCQVWDVDEEEGNDDEVLEGASVKFSMSPTLCDFAHEYVITNISLMSPWLQ